MKLQSCLTRKFFSFIYTDSDSRPQLPFSSSHSSLHLLSLLCFFIFICFCTSSFLFSFFPPCLSFSWCLIVPLSLAETGLLGKAELSSSCQLAHSEVFSVACGCNNTELMQQSAAFCILSNITDATRWGLVWLLSVCSVCKVGCVLEKDRGSKGRKRRGKGGREEK